MNEDTLGPFSSYYSDNESKHRFPFHWKNHTHKHLKNISEALSDRTNANLSYIILLGKTS